MIVCHVILQDHVIKWSHDFMDRSQSKYVTILPIFMARGDVVVCHVVSKDHMIKESCDLIGRNSLR